MAGWDVSVAKEESVSERRRRYRMKLTYDGRRTRGSRRQIGAGFSLVQTGIGGSGRSLARHEVRKTTDDVGVRVQESLGRTFLHFHPGVLKFGAGRNDLSRKTRDASEVGIVKHVL